VIDSYQQKDIIETLRYQPLEVLQQVKEVVPSQLLIKLHPSAAIPESLSHKSKIQAKSLFHLFSC
jgi:hypothetical protein